MARTRMTNTAEFKPQAVRMGVDQHLSVAEVARRLEVGENLLRLWKKAFHERGPDAFPGHGRPSPPTTSCRSDGALFFTRQELDATDRLGRARQAAETGSMDWAWKSVRTV